MTEERTAQPGDLILTRKGRDAGRLMYVLAYSGNRLIVADGRIRPADRPKIKSAKHIQWVGTPSDKVSEKLRHGEKVTNREIRRSINAYLLSSQEGS